MSTFLLIHGAGDVGWSWRLVEARLRAGGHEVLAPDLPCENEDKDLQGTAGWLVDLVGERRDIVVVGHSFGGFVAPLVAARVPGASLVYLAAMIPAPGERAADWWANTGYSDAVREQAARDGGLTGNEDPLIAFYNGVPCGLAEEAQRRSRGQSEATYNDPWPMQAHPDVPTRFVLCRDDHFFPPDFFRRLVPERLGLVPEEMPGCHCVALSHPAELADLLARHAAEVRGLP